MNSLAKVIGLVTSYIVFILSQNRLTKVSMVTVYTKQLMSFLSHR